MRKAGLRIDLAEWAMRKRPHHPDAIVPGHPEKSELIKRIESEDPHYLMPFETLLVQKMRAIAVGIKI